MELLYCINCGKQNINTSKFCIHCGRDIQEGVNNLQSGEKKFYKSNKSYLFISSRSRIIRIAFGLFLILLGILAIYLTYFRPLNQQLTGHLYLGDDIIYSLYFIENNEVVVSIYSIGEFQQPYSIQDSIIDIKHLKSGSIQYKFLNSHQLLLLKSPSKDKFGKEIVIMELRK